MTGARILGAEDFVAAGLAEPGQLREIRRVAGQFAVALTADMAELIDPADPADPIAAQFMPTAVELTEAPEERCGSDWGRALVARPRHRSSVPRSRAT